MKITIKRTVLLDMLRKIAPVIPSKCTIPVGTYVLVRADTFLRLYGFSFETSITTIDGATVAQGGSLCLPFKPLLDLVSSFNGEYIHLAADLERSTAAIHCGDTKVNLKGLQAEEFPPFPQTKPVDRDGVSDVMEKIARYVACCASAEEARPVLNAVRLEMAGTNLVRAVATDGFRLAVYSTGDTGKPEQTALVPVKVIIEAAKLKNPTIWIEEGKFFAADDYTTLASVLVDGAYPQYQAIIPKKTTVSAQVPVKDMLKALQQSRVVSSNQLITLKYEKKRDQDGLLVESASDDSGDLSAWVRAAIMGEWETIALNVNYFIEMLKAVETDEVMIQANRPNMPVKLVMPTRPEWTAIIMPMLKG